MSVNLILPSRFWLILLGFAQILFIHLDRSVGQEPKMDARLVVHTGTNEQRITSLQFSSDSSRLYVAGHDKRVYVWDLTQDEKGHIQSGLPEAPIFWEISRGHRGVIEDIAISSTGQMAVGGTAARSYKDVYIFDTTARRLVGLLPKVAPGADNLGQSWSILDLDWSPSGARLATVDYGGRLCVWNVANSTLVAELQVDNSKIQNRSVCFLNEDTVLATSQVDPSGTIARIDLKAAPPTFARLPQIHQGQAIGLVAIPGTEIWASSDRAQNLYFWRENKLVHTEKLKGPMGEAGRIAVSLHTAGPNARYLLVNTHIEGNGGKAQGELQMWDFLQKPPVKLDSITLNQPTGLRAAISPDELWVASVDNRQNAVQIFELNRDGTFLRPDNSPYQITLEGKASPIKEVHFSADKPHHLGFTTDQAPNHRRVLNLNTANLELGAPRNANWVDSTSSPDQWQLRPSKNREVVSLVKNNDVQGQITLNKDHQGPYSTHAWITDPTQRTTKAIAIGTEFYGIYVYSMPENGVCRLLRYYRDHSDKVRSLSVSSDARYLASGANDATIKIWSLNGIFVLDPKSPAASLWGCAFKIENQKLKVTRVVPDGIAAARGMKEGDFITEVEALDVKYDTADKMLAAIQRNEFWQQLVIKSQRTNQRVAVVPGWEPMASLVVDRQDQWGLWTPKGYYKATAHGDHLFGWVESPRERPVADPMRPDAATPKFIPAKQKRGDFEQDKVLEDLFAGIAPPQVVPALPRPEIRIIEPRWEKPVDPKKEISVTAEVRLPGPVKEYDVDAFVGLSPVDRVPPKPIDGNTFQYQWTVSPGDSYENFVVRVSPKDTHSAHSNHVEQMGYFRTQPKTDPRNLPEVLPPQSDMLPQSNMPRIFVVGIAVAKKYPVAPLEFPVDDVKTLAGLFCHKRPKMSHLFVPGEFEANKAAPELLLEGEVEEGSYQRFVEKISDKLRKAKVKRTDILLVLISGHGENHQIRGFGFKTPRGSIPWISPDKTKKSRSFEALAAIPCRKLILLDACQSGGTVQALWGIPSWKNDAIRGWTEFQAMTFSSSSKDQFSYEHPQIGHSYFTSALLKAFEGEADGFLVEGQQQKRDGKIQFSEVVGYVTKNTYSQGIEVNQSPQFNRAFLPFAGFPLFGVAPKK